MTGVQTCALPIWAAPIITVPKDALASSHLGSPVNAAASSEGCGYLLGLKHPWAGAVTSGGRRRRSQNPRAGSDLGLPRRSARDSGTALLRCCSPEWGHCSHCHLEWRKTQSEMARAGHEHLHGPSTQGPKQLPRWGSFRGQGPAWGSWLTTHSFQVWMWVAFMGSDSSQDLTEFPWYPQEHILTTCTPTYSTMKQGRLEEVDGNWSHYKGRFTLPGWRIYV